MKNYKFWILTAVTFSLFTLVIANSYQPTDTHTPDKADTGKMDAETVETASVQQATASSFAEISVPEEDRLIGRWSFESGNIGRNAAADQFNAKFSKTPATVPGVIGSAVNLTGKGPVIEVGPEALPEKLSEFTFSAWVSPAKLEGDHTIIRKEDVGIYGDNRLLFAFRGGKFLSLGINCGNNYAVCDAVVSPRELCDGNWHLVAGTFDGYVMHVYLDGREIGAMERHAPLNTLYDYMPIKVNYWGDIVAGRYNSAEGDLQIDRAPFFIGSFNGKQDFFTGKLDDVRFYAKALDNGGMDALYKEGKQKPSSGLKKSQQTAASYYRKGTSFIETLEMTDQKLAQAKIDAMTAVELQRLLRADYPAETNAYIMKWQKSPVDNMLLTDKERRTLAENLATPAFEYLPLTDMQWSVLSPADKVKWERIRWIKSQFQGNEDGWVAGMDKNLLGAILYKMEDVTEARPERGERVAAYRKPETPRTVDRTGKESQDVIEADWLYQCGGKPLIERSLQEIKWTRRLASRLENQQFNAQLDELEKKAKAKQADSEDKDLYFAVRTLKRDIMFQNPVVDFESVVYIDNPNPSGSEWQHETKHRLGYSGVPGGRLIVQTGLNPGGKMKQLMPQEPLHGTFWRPDLSYDANRVLFAFKPHNEKTFHLYEIGVDGSGLRQLTSGIFDDFDPVYMPDGKKITFLTTRGHIYVRCMPPTNAFVTAQMPLDVKPGDKSLYILSRSGEPEYTPSVMNDGRVIYTRWEYTDKPLWRAQSLWTMRQNGTFVQTFWGNQSVWPDLLKDARQIPGSEKVMFTGSAHHNWFSGSVGIITPTKGFNFPHGLAKVTKDVEWPECGNGPVDPVENPDYHASGNYDAYYSPYPLSETDFLVSARRKSDGKFVLMLMDTEGNREIINEGAYNIWDAMPVRTRPTPPVYPDNVDWPTYENRDNPSPGTLYSSNVYEGAPQEMKDKAKYLRILSIEHKTYTNWHKRNYVSSGPEISMVQSEGIKKIIGTVPIEPDGSVNFTAPSGIALHFQLLDENQRALQTMKSFTGIQPGESRGCMGCHESHTRTPAVRQTGIALGRKPSIITPVPWKDISVSYERYVQPALDKHCAQCHQDPKHPAYKRFNATLRPGFLGFKEPYVTLLGHPTWSHKYKDKDKKEASGGYGWADIIMVEGFSTVDSLAYQTYPAMTKLSYKSRLVNLMSSGKHHGVKVDPENLLRVILWVDAMGPYYGVEELRKMEDPVFPGKGWLSQPPRICTAPIIQRPGPFDPFYTDEAYDTPPQEIFNQLPPVLVQKE